MKSAIYFILLCSMTSSLVSTETLDDDISLIETEFSHEKYPSEEHVMYAKFLTAITKIHSKLQTPKLGDETEIALKELGEKLKTLEEEQPRIPSLDFCDLDYRFKCFWVIESSDQMTYEDAEKKCKSKSGKIANIYSKEHYDKATKVIREKIPEGKNEIYVWLAMAINPVSGKVIMSNNTPATALFWWKEADYPMLGLKWSGYTQLVVRVTKDSTSQSQGMLHRPPVERWDGVMCEI